MPRDLFSFVAGVSWMLAVAAVGVRYPRVRRHAIMFAATPGFQIAWYGLIEDDGLLLIIPIVVVPLVAVIVAQRRK
ncbi:MAG: hypothetical protein M3O70_15490 [Actinomycetota bacterium]|nr:hypothetical protein [Actinomycetota bacterium]